MLKDLQEYAAKIRERADRVDFAHDDGLDPDFCARAYVFAFDSFYTAEAAEIYLRDRIEYGREKAKKWRTRPMKNRARLIVRAASDGLALLMKQ